MDVIILNTFTFLHISYTTKKSELESHMVYFRMYYIGARNVGRTVLSP